MFEIRKHWSSYFKGYDNFKPFKMRLMEAVTEAEIVAILNDIENRYRS